MVPLSWANREYGASKLKLQERGSRYAFIVLYVWLEHHLSRGNYRRTAAQADELGDRHRRAAPPRRITAR